MTTDLESRTKGEEEAKKKSPLDVPSGNAASDKTDTKKKDQKPKVNALLEQARSKAGSSMRHVQEKVGSVWKKAEPSMRQMGQVTVQKSRELSFGTQMAVAAATASTAHTLGQIGSNPLEHDDDGDDNNDGKKKPKVKGESTDVWVTGLHDYGVQGLSIVGFVSAIVSMVLIVGRLVDLASLFTIVLSPLVFWQKTQLKALGGMRGQQNALREKVNTLTMENDKMKSSIDTMERQVQQLKHVEGELDEIAKKAGGQVDRIVQIVHENGQIQDKIKELLNDDVLQQIITAVLTTDRDGDYTLNRMERRQLEYRLKNIPGIIFHSDRFEQYCASDEGDLTIGDITTIARNLEDPNVPSEQCIFEYKPQEIMEEKMKQQQEQQSKKTAAKKKKGGK